MRRDSAIKKIHDMTEWAKENDVKMVIYTSWSETRPLKTVKGAIDRINKWDHYGLWDHCCYCKFIGKKNGKKYLSAKVAAKH